LSAAVATIEADALAGHKTDQRIAAPPVVS